MTYITVGPPGIRDDPGRSGVSVLLLIFPRRYCGLNNGHKNRHITLRLPMTTAISKLEEYSMKYKE